MRPIGARYKSLSELQYSNRLERRYVFIYVIQATSQEIHAHQAKWGINRSFCHKLDLTSHCGLYFVQ